jgi:hypothetical protein
LLIITATYHGIDIALTIPMRIILLLLILTLPFALYAKFLVYNEPSRLNLAGNDDLLLSGYHFDGENEFILTLITPNETYPALAIPILERSIAGMHISVGTERGFVTASLNPNCTHLLFIDINPVTVLYNRINIALLASAKDYKDYLWLRFNADQKKVLDRLKQSGKLDLLADFNLPFARMFQFWCNHVRRALDKEKRPSLYFFQKKPPSGNWNHAFKGANYLWYPEQCDRLIKMAKAGKMEAHKVDLRRPEQYLPLIQAVQSSGLPVSIIDLSNIHSKKYLELQTSSPEENFYSLAKALEAALSERSIVLLTNYTSPSPKDGPLRKDVRFERTDSRAITYWEEYDSYRYIGFTRGVFARLTRSPQTVAKLRSALDSASSCQNCYPSEQLSMFNPEGIIRVVEQDLDIDHRLEDQRSLREAAVILSYEIDVRHDFQAAIAEVISRCRLEQSKHRK